jgi:ATP-dependent Lon protease
LNLKDLKDLPQEMRDELTFILAERIEEVLLVASRQEHPRSDILSYP